MEKRLEPEIMHPKKKLRAKRTILTCALMILLVSLSVFAPGSYSSLNKNSEKEINARALRPGDVYTGVSYANVAANPAPKFGPNCIGRIAVVIDRSHSVINIAEADGRGRYDYVNEMKFALGGVINGLGKGAQDAGAQLYMIPIAFAGRAVVQTPYTGSSLADFYSFVDSMNIANPANRTRLGYEIGVNENGIFYRDSTSVRYKGPDYSPNLMFGGTINGFPDPWLSLRGYPGDDNGSTNWQGALDAARAQVQFWTPGAPADGDDDFDLVLMITDGIPTSHDADMSGPFLNPDNGDLLAAQGAINALKLGAFGTIPETPVHGLVVGRDAVRGDINEIMGKTFGAGNYTLESNWSNLQNRINSIVQGYSCVPPKEVTTGIAVDATPVSGSIKEGSSGEIEITVENTGEVALTAVTVTINPSGTKDIVVPLWKRFEPDEKITFRHSYRPSVPLGSSNPMSFTATAHGYAVFAPNETPAAGSLREPVSTDPFSFSVERLPLPT